MPLTDLFGRTLDASVNSADLMKGLLSDVKMVSTNIETAKTEELLKFDELLELIKQVRDDIVDEIEETRQAVESCCKATRYPTPESAKTPGGMPTNCCDMLLKSLRRQLGATRSFKNVLMSIHETLRKCCPGEALKSFAEAASGMVTPALDKNKNLASNVGGSVENSADSATNTTNNNTIVNHASATKGDNRKTPILPPIGDFGKNVMALQYVANQLAGAVGKFASALDVDFSMVFKGVISDQVTYLTNIRAAAFETTKFGDSVKETGNSWLEINNDAEETGASLTDIRKLYLKQSQRGLNVETKFSKVQQRTIKDQRSMIKNSAQTAYMIGSSLDDTTEVFDQWQRSLGLTNSELAMMGDHLKFAAKQTGVSGDNLLSAAKSAEQIQKSMKAVGIINPTALARIITEQAVYKKYGVEDLGSMFEQATTSFDELNKLPHQLRSTILAAGMRTGQSFDLVTGQVGQSPEDKQRLWEGVEKHIFSFIGGKGLNKIEDLEGHLEDLDLGLVDNGMEGWQQKLRSKWIRQVLPGNFGMDVGKFIQMTKAHRSEDLLTPEQKLAKLETQKKGLENKGATVPEQLTEGIKEAKLNVSQDRFNLFQTNLERSGSKDKAFEKMNAYLVQKRHQAPMTMGDFENANRSLVMNLKSESDKLGKRAKADEILKKSGYSSFEELATKINSNDATVSLDASKAMREISNIVGINQKNEDNPVATMLQQVREINEKLSGIAAAWIYKLTPGMLMGILGAGFVTSILSHTLPLIAYSKKFTIMMKDIFSSLASSATKFGTTIKTTISTIKGPKTPKVPKTPAPPRPSRMPAPIAKTFTRISNKLADILPTFARMGLFGKNAKTTANAAKAAKMAAAAAGVAGGAGVAGVAGGAGVMAKIGSLINKIPGVTGALTKVSAILASPKLVTALPTLARIGLLGKGAKATAAGMAGAAGVAGTAAKGTGLLGRTVKAIGAGVAGTVAKGTGLLGRTVKAIGEIPGIGKLAKGAKFLGKVATPIAMAIGGISRQFDKEGIGKTYGKKYEDLSSKETFSSRTSNFLTGAISGLDIVTPIKDLVVAGLKMIGIGVPDWLSNFDLADSLGLGPDGMVTKALAKFFGWLWNVVAKAIELFQPLIDSIGGDLAGIGGDLKKTLVDIWETASGTFSIMYDAIKSIDVIMKSTFGFGTIDILKGIGIVIGAVIIGFIGLALVVVKMATAFIKAVTGIINYVSNFAKSLVENVNDSINAGKGFFATIGNLISTFCSKVIEGIQGMIDWVRNSWLGQKLGWAKAPEPPGTEAATRALSPEAKAEVKTSVDLQRELGSKNITETRGNEIITKLEQANKAKREMPEEKRLERLKAIIAPRALEEARTGATGDQRTFWERLGGMDKKESQDRFINNQRDIINKGYGSDFTLEEMRKTIISGTLDDYKKGHAQRVVGLPAPGTQVGLPAPGTQVGLPAPGTPVVPKPPAGQQPINPATRVIINGLPATPEQIAKEIARLAPRPLTGRPIDEIIKRRNNMVEGMRRSLEAASQEAPQLGGLPPTISVEPTPADKALEEMAEEATKSGSIYTHDIHLEGLYDQNIIPMMTQAQDSLNTLNDSLLQGMTVNLTQGPVKASSLNAGLFDRENPFDASMESDRLYQGELGLPFTRVEEPPVRERNVPGAMIDEQSLGNIYRNVLAASSTFGNRERTSEIERTSRDRIDETNSRFGRDRITERSSESNLSSLFERTSANQFVSGSFSRDVTNAESIISGIKSFVNSVTNDNYKLNENISEGTESQVLSKSIYNTTNSMLGGALSSVFGRYETKQDTLRSAVETNQARNASVSVQQMGLFDRETSREALITAHDTDVARMSATFRNDVSDTSSLETSAIIDRLVKVLGGQPGTPTIVAGDIHMIGGSFDHISPQTDSVFDRRELVNERSMMDLSSQVRNNYIESLVGKNTYRSMEQLAGAPGLSSGTNYSERNYEVMNSVLSGQEIYGSDRIRDLSSSIQMQNLGLFAPGTGADAIAEAAYRDEAALALSISAAHSLSMAPGLPGKQNASQALGGDTYSRSGNYATGSRTTLGGDTYSQGGRTYSTSTLGGDTYFRSGNYMTGGRATLGGDTYSQGGNYATGGQAYNGRTYDGTQFGGRTGDIFGYDQSMFGINNYIDRSPYTSTNVGGGTEIEGSAYPTSSYFGAAQLAGGSVVVPASGLSLGLFDRSTSVDAMDGADTVYENNMSLGGPSLVSALNQMTTGSQSISRTTNPNEAIFMEGPRSYARDGSYLTTNQTGDMRNLNTSIGNNFGGDRYNQMGLSDVLYGNGITSFDSVIDSNIVESSHDRLESVREQKLADQIWNQASVQELGLFAPQSARDAIGAADDGHALSLAIGMPELMASLAVGGPEGRGGAFHPLAMAANEGIGSQFVSEMMPGDSVLSRAYTQYAPINSSTQQFGLFAPGMGGEALGVAGDVRLGEMGITNQNVMSMLRSLEGMPHPAATTQQLGLFAPGMGGEALGTAGDVRLGEMGITNQNVMSMLEANRRAPQSIATTQQLGLFAPGIGGEALGVAGDVRLGEMGITNQNVMSMLEADRRVPQSAATTQQFGLFAPGIGGEALGTAGDVRLGEMGITNQNVMSMLEANKGMSRPAGRMQQLGLFAPGMGREALVSGEDTRAAELGMVSPEIAAVLAATGRTAQDRRPTSAAMRSFGLFSPDSGREALGTADETDQARLLGMPSTMFSMMSDAYDLRNQQATERSQALMQNTGLFENSASGDANYEYLSSFGKYYGRDLNTMAPTGSRSASRSGRYRGYVSSNIIGQGDTEDMVARQVEGGKPTGPTTLMPGIDGILDYLVGESAKREEDMIRVLEEIRDGLRTRRTLPRSIATDGEGMPSSKRSGLANVSRDIITGYMSEAQHDAYSAQTNHTGDTY